MRSKPLLVIFLTVFIDLVGFGMIIPLSPYLAREYGADAFGVGLLMAIYSLMQFAFAPFWGRLSDRWGRRPIILVSLLGAGLSHLMFGFATSLAVLFVARGFAGIFGANIATAMAYIADVTDEKDRSKGMGLVGAAFGLGFVMGPFIGGVAAHVGTLLGDQAPFGESLAGITAGIICLGNFILAYFVLPETHKKEGAAEFSQQQTKQQRWAKMAFALRRPFIGPLLAVYFLSTFALANIEAPLFLYVKDHFMWSQIKASFGFAYVGLIMVFTQGYLVRKVIPKIGEANSMSIGLALYSFGFLGVALTQDFTGFVIAVTLIGLGNGLSNPAITGSVSLLTSSKDQGLVLGVNQSLSAMGRILGPALGGLLYREINSGAPFVAAALFVGLGLTLVLLLRTRLPQLGREAKGET